VGGVGDGVVGVIAMMKKFPFIPLHLRAFEDGGWLLVWKGSYLSSWHPKERPGYPKFKLSIGKWIVERY
jgi:hypothetical protein